MIRVTHPYHPLYNQIVNVLRRAGNPAYPEPCYLIELPDGTRAELPVSWAEIVDPSDPPPARPDHTGYRSRKRNGQNLAPLDFLVHMYSVSRKLQTKLPG